ncbi:MAG: hypothetical protein ACXWTR_05795, partial [Methylotenera sp.]
MENNSLENNMHTSFKRFLAVWPLQTYLLATCLAAFIAMSPARAAEEVPYLLTAASKGDLDTVSAMLTSGASANTKDGDGI